MVTRSIFTGLVVLLAFQRYWELRLSKRNEATIRSRGGREYGAWQVKAMKALHVGWFVSMLVEVYGLRRPLIPGLALTALFAFVTGESLRYAAILCLKWRWTIRVMTIASLPPVRQGIYRYLDHPNYLGVVLEILAVPLIYSAYLTAVVFSVVNLLLLAARIRTEDRALLEAASSSPSPAGQNT